MKATGIVRRIDDLGRVVVPKEIRRRETAKRIMMENRSARKWSSLLKQEVVRWRMHRRKIARN